MAEAAAADERRADRRGEGRCRARGEVQGSGRRRAGQAPRRRHEGLDRSREGEVREEPDRARSRAPRRRSRAPRYLFGLSERGGGQAGVSRASGSPDGEPGSGRGGGSPSEARREGGRSASCSERIRCACGGPGARRAVRSRWSPHPIDSTLGSVGSAAGQRRDSVEIDVCRGRIGSSRCACRTTTACASRTCVVRRAFPAFSSRIACRARTRRTVSHAFAADAAKSPMTDANRVAASNTFA